MQTKYIPLEQDKFYILKHPKANNCQNTPKELFKYIMLDFSQQTKIKQTFSTVMRVEGRNTLVIFCSK